MAHIAKYNRSQIGHLCAHYERKKNEITGEYIRFSNRDIDTSKSPLNYNLAPHRDSQTDYIRDRCLQVHCSKRSDVNVMCSWVVTAPQTLPEEEHRRFFETVYNALEFKYGRDNVVSAWVHMDETNPHIHFAFIPVVYDKKKGYHKVCAKDLITKDELLTFHPWLSEEVQKVFGYDVGIETGELHGRENLDLKEFKKTVKKSDLDALRQMGDIDRASERKRQFAGFVTLREDDYKMLHSYALHCNAAINYADNFREENAALRRRVEKLSQPSETDLMIENAELKKKLKAVSSHRTWKEKALYRFIDSPVIRPLWVKYLESEFPNVRFDIDRQK